MDEPEVSKEAVLDKDGSVSIALLGDTSLLGMTTAEAALSIKRALAEYIVKPEVNVELVDIGKYRVFVVGQVKKPGLYMMSPGSKILEALTTAEYDENSDLTRVTVNRGEQVIELDLTAFLKKGDISRNILLQPEDTIVVAKQEMGHTALVLGEVNKPGATPLKADMTVREVMAAAGGVTPQADTLKIVIKHTGTSESVPVDYAKALQGDPSADIIVMSGDTVYVPKAEDAYFIVQGGVNQPGRYPWRLGMTIDEATALAGGFNRDAKMDNIELVHRDGDKVTSEKVNLINARKGTEPMAIVRPMDTVVVPMRKTSEWAQILTGIGAFGWLFHN
jgi:protein involved in polysaccharide export with SLBB domain